MPKFLIAPCVAIAVLLPAVAATAKERPVVRGFSISPARFAAVNAGARHGGARLHFRLSKPATVRISIARHRGRHYHHVGTLVLRHQRKGRHTHRFRGRLHGHKLAAGRYRARLVATDGRHRHSARRTEYFRIVRRSGSGRPSPTSPGGSRTFTPPSGTGVPAGWQPTTIRSNDMTVRRAGAVIENYRFTDGAKLHVEAPDVVVRNSEFQGGQIDTAERGVLIQNVTMDRLAPESTDQEGAISYCGYTADHVAILGRSEGFRDGCGLDTHITNSFVRIDPPAQCGDWHGDGIQGYTGDASVHNVLYVENTIIDFNERMPNGSFCGGTSPFFFVGGPGGSPNGEVHVNGLLLKGGGYSFRMGTPGSVQGLKIVNHSWGSAPISITDSGCGPISPWDAQVVTVDAGWNVTGVVRSLACRNG